MYGFQILNRFGKRVKTKRKIGGTLYVCKSYRGKTNRGGFLAVPPHPPTLLILNRAKGPT